MTLTSNISLVVSALLEQGEDLDSTLKAPVDINLLRKLTSDEADLLWYKTNTLAGGEALTLNLTSGLADAFGNTLAFDNIKVMAFVASTSNTDDVLVGGGTFYTWLVGGGDAIRIRPGGACFITAPNDGFAVVADTGDNLQIFNNSEDDPNTYSMILIGQSA